MNHLKNKVLVIFTLVVLISACSTIRFPGVHRLTIQQGNVITQSMIDKLKPGMTKSQVIYVLGNPIVDDSLDRERWDYVYSIQVPGLNLIQSKLHLFFVEERLSHFEGDFLPSTNIGTVNVQTDQASANIEG
ncbi:MAG TPA: outer membrane protein assembly factor BamE [Pseudomonadales bacterium]|nr:outer membrane protein assembly factor BamE [Pseudomonadales bacterium]